MKIGIIAAMEEELRELRKRLERPRIARRGAFVFYTGRLLGHRVTLLRCGIGKVNAAVGTALLINEFAPERVINTGVAGGFPPDKLRVGDIVVSAEVRHHDADATIFDYEFGQIPKMPAAYYPDKRLLALAMRALKNEKDARGLRGQIMSGDSFIHNPRQIRDILKKFPSVMAVEMEGAAIAQTCYLFHTPFLVIRSISDIVTADKSHKVYKTSMPEAARRSVALVLKLLGALRAEKTK